MRATLSSAAASTASPKRKRDPYADPASVAPFAPRLTTTATSNYVFTPTSTPPPGAGESSPRTAVADQFRDLNLKAPIPVDFGAGGGAGGNGSEDKEERKRAKRSDSVNSGREELDGFRNMRICSEVPETPQPTTKTTKTSGALNTLVNTAGEEYGEGATGALHVNPPTQPLPAARLRKKSPSPPVPLDSFWQDNEITGHLIGPAQDPDDDGTGINGVGFRPTPAMAYARAQKRRQQVQAWRAREAKEARAKRSERRTRGVGSGNVSGPEDAGSEGSRRIVRFA
ncbi:hypothetical protein BU16DRAFT_569470 [Lophium mytilinum]|uniref:Uncharacterized protein n=1 Tax=Lophium mytilinum TaxID=390894 RepID=A0A6A6R992_9PEZI|nr:hypothetical protein BU16DRAFT_569470 [Lophium mytilinum]